MSDVGMNDGAEMTSSNGTDPMAANDTDPLAANDTDPLAANDTGHAAAIAEFPTTSSRRQGSLSIRTTRWGSGTSAGTC